MINKLNVATIWVLDKQQALDFYVDKLGLEKGSDVKQGPYRWLTVRVPSDPGFEISLEQPGPPIHDEATAEQLRDLITKGALSGLVLLTDDARALYETLKERGVTDFTQEPTDHFYGTDMGIRDPFATASGSSSTSKGRAMATTKNVGLSEEEKAAARERVRELKAEAKRGANREAGEKALLDNIAAMPTPDRVMAERLHAIVTKNAPELMPKTWYGMPAWATKDGKLVCFFKAASKFGQRYATFGFEEDGMIDDGTMWATSWGILKLSPEDEKKLAALVKKAVS